MYLEPFQIVFLCSVSVMFGIFSAICVWAFAVRSGQRKVAQTQVSGNPPDPDLPKPVAILETMCHRFTRGASEGFVDLLVEGPTPSLDVDTDEKWTYVKAVVRGVPFEGLRLCWEKWLGDRPEGLPFTDAKRTFRLWKDLNLLPPALLSDPRS